MSTNLEDFLKLYESHFIHIVARDLVDPQDIDDIVQNVALRALQALQQYEQEGITIHHSRAWLRTITRNVCFSYLAKKAIQSICLSLEKAEEDGWLMTTNLDEAARPIIQREFYHLVNSLLTNEINATNAMIIARRLAGLKHAEIAQEMRMTTFAIRSRWSKSLGHLQEQLRRRAFDEEDLQ